MRAGGALGQGSDVVECKRQGRELNLSGDEHGDEVHDGTCAHSTAPAAARARRETPPGAHTHRTRARDDRPDLASKLK